VRSRNLAHIVSYGYPIGATDVARYLGGILGARD